LAAEIETRALEDGEGQLVAQVMGHSRGAFAAPGQVADRDLKSGAPDQGTQPIQTGELFGALAPLETEVTEAGYSGAVEPQDSRTRMPHEGSAEPGARGRGIALQGRRGEALHACRRTWLQPAPGDVAGHFAGPGKDSVHGQPVATTRAAPQGSLGPPGDPQGFEGRSEGLGTGQEGLHAEI